MSRISHLHRLVVYLTPFEKRIIYHRLASATQGKSNQQLELFEALANSAIRTDPQNVIAQLPLPLQKNLPTILRRLRASILKEVLGETEANGIQIKLSSNLAEIRWLFERNLLNQIPWILKKTSKKAEQFEENSILMELLYCERRLMQIKRPSCSLAYLGELEKREDQVIKRHRQVVRLTQLRDEILFYIRFGDDTGNLVQTRLSEIMSMTIVGNALTALDKRSRMMALAIEGYCHRILGQAASAVDSFEALLEEWESAPDWIREYPDAYLKDYNQFQSHSLIGSNDLAPLEKHAQKLLSLPIAHPKLRFRFTYYGFQQQIIVYMNFMEWDLAEKVAVESEQWMRENWKLFDMAQKLAYLYNFAVLRYIRGNFSKAKTFLQEIMNLKANSERLDLRGAARLLYLSVNLAAEEYEYSENLIKSARIWFARNFDHWDFQSRLLGLANQIVRAQNLPPYAFQQFLDEVQEMPLVVGANEIIIWAISQTSGIEMQKASEVRFAKLGRGK